MKVLAAAAGLLLLAGVTAGHAQLPASLPSTPALAATLAIPESPAFELLSLDASAIMRPQTTRDLALSLSRFQAQDGSFALPQALGVEFAPLLLFPRPPRTGGPDLSAAAYSLRLSLATRRDSAPGSPSFLAAGVRLSIANDADFGTDGNYGPDVAVTPILEQINAIYGRVIVRQGPDTTGNAVQAVENGLTRDEREQIEELRNEIRRRWAARYWNASITELAFAARVQSPDSTGRDPDVDQVSGWFSMTRRLGWKGQLLFGARISGIRPAPGASLELAEDLALRLYYGNNTTKAYLEAQGSSGNNREGSLLFQGGFELSAAEWLWFTMSVSYQDASNGLPRRVTTSYRVQTTIPGL